MSNTNWNEKGQKDGSNSRKDDFSSKFIRGGLDRFYTPPSNSENKKTYDNGFKNGLKNKP